MNSDQDFVIRSGEYALRPLCEDDLRMVLNWRNSPRVHAKMLTDHKITWEEHVNWFRRIQNDPIKRHFIFTYNDKSVGYVAYNAFDSEKHTCEPGVYIADPKSCPVDADTVMAALLAEYGYTKLGIERMNFDILASNKRVVKLNQLYGCVVERDKDYYVEKDGKRQLVLCGYGTKEMWLQQKSLSLDG